MDSIAGFLKERKWHIKVYEERWVKIDMGPCMFIASKNSIYEGSFKTLTGPERKGDWFLTREGRKFLLRLKYHEQTNNEPQEMTYEVECPIDNEVWKIKAEQSYADTTISCEMSKTR
jgi:hypothetical protein